MALIIAITYSLTDDNNADLNIENATENRIIVTNVDDTVNDSNRILNATEIFTMLLATDWPLTGNSSIL